MRSESYYNAQHRKRIDKLSRQVYNHYVKAIQASVIMGLSVEVDPEKPFSFSHYPGLKTRVNNMLSDLYSGLITTINSGTAAEWDWSNQKNDDLVKSLFGENMPKALEDRFLGHNLEALRTFQKRKTDGMDLSGRVWNYTEQFKGEIEMALDVGLTDGRSAAQLSQDVRKYLNEPDKLFRRVRDKRGVLQLSKAAKNYHPGQGVYRSSYKNAMRLTRTEVNMAYREADHSRWEDLDFVVGFQVHRSNNPYACDVCESLQGKYPKSFKFKGWHPQCMCYVTSILATREEMDKITEAILNDEDLAGFRSVNEVNGVPASFSQWIDKNNERLLRAKSQPYFIKDNFKDGSVLRGLKPSIGVVDLKPDGFADYERQLGIKANPEIFKHFTKGPISFKSEGRRGAYFDPANNLVNIPVDERRKNSNWSSQSVVYHEFGHALDWQHGLKETKEVNSLMSFYRDKYQKNSSARFRDMSERVDKIGFESASTGNFDRMEQAGAFADTLMSLNYNFGRGHSKEYFQVKGMSAAEFLAHAFENKYLGNPVFKELAPDLYEESIELIDKLLSKLM